MWSFALFFSLSVTFRQRLDLRDSRAFLEIRVPKVTRYDTHGLNMFYNSMPNKPIEWDRSNICIYFLHSDDLLPIMSSEVVNRWFMLSLKHQATLFQLIFKIVFNSRICDEKLHYPWCCAENSTNQRVLVRPKELFSSTHNIFVYMYAYFAINVKYIVYVNTIQCIVWYFSIVFTDLLMLFAVLHGIVVLSFIKTINLSLLSLSFCPIFKYLIFFKSILFSILLLAGWFGSRIIILRL